MAQSMSILIEDPDDPGTYLIRSVDYAGSPDDPGHTPSEPFLTKLEWGRSGDRFYEAGVDRGVLYPEGLTGVVWNGLISVSESPSGGEAMPYYLDGVKYANPSAPEEWGASIEAYTYPDEFELCDGTAAMAQGFSINQQSRKSFGLSYRTRIGNDIDAENHGYKLHIIYNAQADPTEKAYQSFGDTSDPSTFNWKLSARPAKFVDPAFGVKYGSHLVLDSTKVYPWAMKAVEEVLYGTLLTEARLPTPQELLNLFVDNALLQITDNGDGTWTAVGPDSSISMVDTEEFQIDWPSAVFIDANTYKISSL